jgi:hypothetical protein
LILIYLAGTVLPALPGTALHGAARRCTALVLAGIELGAWVDNSPL